MDLDTNAKKFKYSLLCKIICVLLCLITALSACLITAGGVFAVERNLSEDKNVTDWTDTIDFRYHLMVTTTGIIGEALYGNDVDKLEKELKEAEDEAVNAVYEYLIAKISKVDYLSGEDYLYFSEILPNEKYPRVTVETENFGKYEFIYEWNDGILYSDLYDEISYYYENTFVDVTVENYQNNYRDYYYSYDTEDVCFLIEKDGKFYNGNRTSLDSESIKNKEMYFVISDGKIQDSKNISSDTIDFIMSSDDNIYKKTNYTLYLYIDLSGNNWYAFNHDLFKMTDKINAHFYQFLAVDIICIVLSFFLAFYYFQITGRKKEYDNAKLWFTDYVPFEIQLCAAGGLGFGAFVLFCNASEMMYDFQMTVLAYVLLCFAVWLLLFALSSSVARYAHSGKKFYKHLSTYWVLFGAYKVLAFIFKGTVKLFRKMKASAKKTSGLLKYKPQYFKRNVILLTILYFVVNLILILFIAVLFAGVPPLGFVAVIGDLAGNIVIVNKVLKYVKYLDMIITASSQHTDIEADLNLLPESLRVLAESMKYKNAELQHAINKAVKDERLRTELITNVSHDLKTPLTSIITYVDLLSKCDINDEKAKEYISVLDDKGAKLKRLIDDLIEASKVTSGNITVNSAPMNLSELCLQATVDAQQGFEKAGLDLIVKQGETPTTIIADGAKTFRIVENLLSNARKYSAKASRVYVSVYDEGDKGVFEIKNISAQPLDISPDELTERFVRGDKSRNQEGNGLGLSIAKELCRVQGGNLEITIDGDLFKAKVKLPKA